MTEQPFMRIGRKNMKLLIDTNILMDFIKQREPFFEDSKEILSLCSERTAEGCVAVHSIPTLYYLLRKDFSENERRRWICDICRILQVAGFDTEAAVKSAENIDFRDFEDCLQAECAKAVGAEYIVTRNTDDFSESPVPAVTPAAILKILEEKA